MKLLQKILEKTQPTPTETEKIKTIASSIIQKINVAAQKAGVEVRPLHLGSTARNTFLRNDKDIDIFICFPPSLTYDDLKKTGLKLAKEGAGEKYREEYAEHPYIVTEIDNYRIDIVPCYDVTDPSKIKSAVDRTPHHHKYIKKKLSASTQNQIRLLKQFTVGIGIYGAEQKIQGISGYLAELLTLHYQTFLDTIQDAATNWRKGYTIDIEQHYKDPAEPEDLFPQDPLIVIDPVDRGRNVAAALSKTNFSKFIVAARAFLQNPKKEFFFPKPIQPPTQKTLKQKISTRSTHLLLIKLHHPEMVPDVIWPQLRKTIRSFQHTLEKHGFKLLRKSVWTNEKDTATLLFDVINPTLPNIKKHIGPPIFVAEKQQQAFLKKYSNAKETVSGPYVDGDRWMVEIVREHRDVSEFLTDLLKEQKFQQLSIGKNLLPHLKNAELLENKAIINFYSENPDFAQHLTQYLDNRLPWQR